MNINREITNWYDEILRNLDRYKPTNDFIDYTTFVDTESIEVLEDNEQVLKIKAISMDTCLKTTFFNEKIYSFYWKSSLLRVNVINKVMHDEDKQLWEENLPIEKRENDKVKFDDLNECYFFNDDEADIVHKYHKKISLRDYINNKKELTEIEKHIKVRDTKKRYNQRCRNLSVDEFENKPSSVYLKLKTSGDIQKYIDVKMLREISEEPLGIEASEEPLAIEATVFEVGKEIKSTTSIYAFAKCGRKYINKQIVYKTSYSSEGNFVEIEKINAPKEVVENNTEDFDIANWVHALVERDSYNSDWKPYFSDDDINSIRIASDEKRFIASNPNIWRCYWDRYIDKNNIEKVTEDDEKYCLKVPWYYNEWDGFVKSVSLYQYSKTETRISGFEKKLIEEVYDKVGSHVETVEKNDIKFDAEADFVLKAKTVDFAMAAKAFELLMGKPYGKNLYKMSLKDIEGNPSRYKKYYEDEEKTIYLDLESMRVLSGEGCTEGYYGSVAEMMQYNKITVYKKEALIEEIKFAVHPAEPDYYERFVLDEEWGCNSYEYDMAVEAKYDFDGNILEYEEEEKCYFSPSIVLEFKSFDYNLADFVYNTLYGKSESE